MAETVIRVEPGSVKKYGSTAQAKFDALRADLVALVNETAGVHYFGPNAMQFKKGCGELAADFSGRLLKDMVAIADAIRQTTTAIASSLGGQAIQIKVDGSAVALPSIAPGDGALDVDLSALDALLPTVQKRFKAINDALTTHLAALSATDWKGNAKNAAVDVVSQFTKVGQTASGEAEKSITEYIRKQIESTRSADK